MPTNSICEQCRYHAKMFWQCPDSRKRYEDTFRGECKLPLPLCCERKPVRKAAEGCPEWAEKE